MKNSLTDLNNHLFSSLERLNDESLKPEEIEREIEKAKAIKDIAKGITENAKLELEAHNLNFKMIQEGFSNTGTTLLGRSVVSGEEK